MIEYHGNASTLSCLSCGNQYESDKKKDHYPPRCRCEGILKPDVVFFGEAIPQDAMNRSFQLASSAEALLVIGTSAVVQPAALMPAIASEHGAAVIEFNLEPTPHSGLALYSFFGKAGETLPKFWDAVKKL